MAENEIPWPPPPIAAPIAAPKVAPIAAPKVAPIVPTLAEKPRKGLFCDVDGCGKHRLGRTSKCSKHGGGARCRVDGCGKGAQGGTDLCVRHGGGYKCDASARAENEEGMDASV